jgi:hypothetical protein
MSIGPSFGDSTLRDSRMLGNVGTSTVKKTEGQDPAPGAGSITATGQAPDPARPGMMSAVMASLSAIMPKMTGQQVDVLLLQVTAKMKDTISEGEQKKIETDTKVKQTQIAEKKSKLEEADRKIQEAKDKMDHMSIWDKIKLGFQYLGAILSIVAGVLAMVAGIAAGALTLGIGAPAALASVIGGAMLVTSGILMLGMAADATYAACNKPDGLGFVGQITKEVKMKEGMSEEDAVKEATHNDMISRIVVGGLAALLAIAGSIAALPLAFASGGSTIASLVGTAAQTGGAIAKASTSMVSTVTGFIGGISQIAEGAGDMTVGIMKRDAQDEKSEGMRTQADAKKMEALIQSLDDMIDLAMGRLKASGERFDAMLDSLTDAIKDRGDSMARVGLRA